MAKKQLKIYYATCSSSDGREIEVVDTVYCCREMKREFDNFEVDYPDDLDEMPAIMIRGKDDNFVIIDYCPFCGEKITIKPSRL